MEVFDSILKEYTSQKEGHDALKGATFTAFHKNGTYLGPCHSFTDLFKEQPSSNAQD